MNLNTAEDATLIHGTQFKHSTQNVVVCGNDRSTKKKVQTESIFMAELPLNGEL